MPDFHFTFLSEKELPALRETFLSAFSDYFVPIQLNEQQFRAKIKREGVDPSFCAAALKGDKMVGFILTGLGEWQGKPTAYNAGTGVVPEHRRNGLSERLYQFMLPKLRQSGIELCLLEVIQENEAAQKVYEKTGFSVTRSLDCFRSNKQDLLLQVESPADTTITAAHKPDWKAYKEMWDVQPTWQNTPEAVKRSLDDKVILEARDTEQALVGYIAFFPRSGAIAQLVVKKEDRGRGVATALLRQAASITEAPALMLINIDTSAKNFISYLERRHFKHFLTQNEMLMPLS